MKEKTLLLWLVVVFLGLSLGKAEDHGPMKGTVVLRFTITKEGKAENPVVISSTNPVFTRMALKAVKKWRFHPATKDGHSVPVIVEQPFDFDLSPPLEKGRIAPSPVPKGKADSASGSKS